MKRFLTLAILGASLALSACTTAGTAPPGSISPPISAPAPLAATEIDEKALTLAYLSFDATLDVVDALIATGAIVPGHPRSIQLADAIDRTTQALAVASSAREAGDTREAGIALQRAAEAVSEIRALFRRTPAP